MKTVFKQFGSAGLSLAALTVLLGAIDGVSHAAMAAGMTPPPPTTTNFPSMNTPPTNMPAPTTATPPAAGAPSQPAPVAMGQPTPMAMPSAVPTPTPMTAANPSPMPVMPAAGPGGANEDEEAADTGKDKDKKADNKAKSDKKLAVLEDKVSDSVRDVVKHLGTTTENVTLDDLNSARQAIAKLDALIDIEKHLSDLDKIRSERESNGAGGNSHGLAAAIPASALAPMPMQMGSPFPPMANMQTAAVAPPVPTLMPVSSIEVTRIVGSDGRFVATMKTPDGQSKPVHVGDKLTDGSSITGITSKGVVLDQNGTKHVIPVKNVGEVFGSTR